MKIKSCIITATATLLATLLVGGVSASAKNETIVGDGGSEYRGFSYEAASPRKAADSLPAAKTVEVEKSEENSIEEYGDASLFLEDGKDGDSLSGEEKLIRGLLKGDREIEFDYDDFVYEMTPDNSQCEEFIDYYYSLIYSDERLSHVYYGFESLKRGSIDGGKTYFVGSIMPKYDNGKSGMEKLISGLENEKTYIEFDYNDFAYHTDRDGQLCAKFQKLVIDIASEHPEYRIKSFTLGYVALSRSIYSIAYLKPEYDLPIPEDDGVPPMDKIMRGLENCEETIEFDSNDFTYTLPEGATNEYISELVQNDLGARYFSLIDAHPELFYLDAQKRYSYSVIPLSNNTFYVASLSPVYNGMTDKEINNARKFIDEKTEAIVDYLEEYADTDFEKALLLHDYICLNFEYDESLTYHDIYSFLSKGTGVCDSYSKLYRYILEDLGINVKYASSEAMEHLWNVVELDGRWYNIDVTWDDPTPEKPGYVRHDYFLVSDADFKSTEIYGEEYGFDAVSNAYTGYHHDYVTDDGIICESSYDGDFWTARAKKLGSNIQAAPIVFDDSSYYYLSNTFDINSFKSRSTIVAVSKTDATSLRNVVLFEDMWESVDGTEVYPGAYSGLALVNGVLVYNTPTEIRYVLPNGNHNVRVASISYDDDEYDKHHKNHGGKIYRFGISLDGKKYEHEIFYTILNNKNKSADNGKNNYFGITNKYDKYDKNGKNKEQIEIDYYIADSSSDTDFDERDFIIDISSDTIHSFEKSEEHKATYLTKGWWKKVCKVCLESETEEIEPTIMNGSNAHEPNAKDVVSVVEALVGKGALVDGSDDSLNPDSSLDFDEDGKFKLHDIFRLMRMIREQKEQTR